MQICYCSHWNRCAETAKVFRYVDNDKVYINIFNILEGKVENHFIRVLDYLHEMTEKWQYLG